MVIQMTPNHLDITIVILIVYDFMVEACNHHYTHQTWSGKEHSCTSKSLYFLQHLVHTIFLFISS